MTRERELGHAAQFVSAARGSESFDAQLIAFLRKGFGPTLSSNARASRTDVLIEKVLVNAKRAGTILDLCSGWPLFLAEHLIEQHSNNRVREGSCRYVACDASYGHEGIQHKLRELKGRGRSSGVEIFDLPADASRPADLHDHLRRTVDGQFDLIFFANALHEIPLPSIPELLFTLVELLADDGQLVIIDPETNWLLHPSRWVLDHLEDLPVDWEDLAVWLPKDLYHGMLAEFGCDVQYIDAPRTQAFYVLQAHRSTTFDVARRRELVNAATESLRDSLATQIKHEIERYVECREELRAALPNALDEQKKPLLHKAVEFFSICASQARRIEILGRLG